MPARLDPAVAAEVEQVILWLASAGTVGQVREAIAAKYPAASADQLLNLANQTILANGDNSAEMGQYLLGLIRSGIHSCIRGSIEAHDFGTALQGWKALAQTVPKK